MSLSLAAHTRVLTFYVLTVNDVSPAPSPAPSGSTRAWTRTAFKQFTITSARHQSLSKAGGSLPAPSGANLLGGTYNVDRLKPLAVLVILKQLFQNSVNCQRAA